MHLRLVLAICLLTFSSVCYGQKKPDYKKYPAKATTVSKLAPIQYRSHWKARLYKSRITETYREHGANFAGHYCFIFWGCGSGCKGAAIVDVVTGKVYDAPDGTHAYSYKKDSRLLALNEGEGGQCPEDPFTCEQQWVWQETQKKFVLLYRQGKEPVSEMSRR